MIVTGLPNALTLSRIGAIPVVLGLLYTPGVLTDWLAAGVFMLAGVTDYLDGYFARTWRQTSAFGRFLDPIADKLLVASTLLVLVGVDRIQGYSLIAALIILCREILVSGLREFLAELHVAMPVSRLAKWKTTLQMTALACLLVEDHFIPGLSLHEIGLWSLWAAATLTLSTGYDYLKAALNHMETQT